MPVTQAYEFFKARLRTPARPREDTLSRVGCERHQGQILAETKTGENVMHTIAKLAALAVSVTALHGAACAQDRSAGAAPMMGAALSTMTVDGPAGDAYRFDYFAERGWVFVAHTAAKPEHPAQLAANGSLAGMSAAITPEQGQRGRFVDGPTGYVFEWTPEGRWHFVGKNGSAEQR
jgi:hypothetical protein